MLAVNNWRSRIVKLTVISVQSLMSKPLEWEGERPRTVWIVKLVSYPHHGDIELSNDALPVDSEENKKFIEFASKLSCGDRITMELHHHEK